MVILLAVAAVGGTAVIGLGRACMRLMSSGALPARRPGEAPRQNGAPPAANAGSLTVEAAPGGEASALARFEEKYQRVVQDGFAELMGSHRRRQHLELSKDNSGLETPAGISERDRIVNRYLGLSGLLSASALASSAAPPLLVVTVPLAFSVLQPIYRGAYDELVRRRTVSFSTLEAIFGTGLWLTGHFVSGGISLLLYFIIRKMSLVTQDQVRHKMVDVYGQQSRTVWIVAGAQEIEIPFDRVQTGDLVAVRTGEAVPVDGIVRKGLATVDQHRLTGESQPVAKGVGDAVLATTVVVEGQIQIEVEHRGSETVAAQIADILERTTGHDLEIANRGARLAERAVQPAILASVVALPLKGASAALATISSIPGSHMFLAAPLTLLNFLNFASKRSILVKDGHALEALHSVRTVVFDKTGTLTLDQPEVSGIHVCNGVNRNPSEDEILKLAAAAEYRHVHPIARAIVAAAAARGLELPAVEHSLYEIGYGIQVVCDGSTVRVGSVRFMQMSEIPVPSEIREAQAACHDGGHSLVLVAVDDEVAGAIELRPSIRPEAKAVVESLHERGLSICIVSGDHEAPTRVLAERLGIDRYFANVLPKRKAELVEQLQAEEGNVCFVGDGINDAIALKKACVSVSLRGATSVATDTAQIVLMDRSLNELPVLFDLGRDLDRNLRASFAISVGTGVLIIGGVWVLNLGLVSALFLSRLSFGAVFGNTLLPAAIKYRTVTSGPREDTSATGQV